MAGPLHRFLALHRYWLILLFCIGLMGWLATAAQVDGADRVLVVAIFMVVIWVPLTLLMVLIPRLRGFALIVGVMACLLQIIDPDEVVGPWGAPAAILGVCVLVLIASRIRVPLHLRGRLHFDHPANEVAANFAYREWTDHWSSMLERVERHPDRPGRWRCHLAMPFGKLVPHFDAELVEALPHGGIVARIEADHGKLSVRSVIRRELVPKDGGTEVTSHEHTRADLVSAAMFLLDRTPLDHLHQLRFHLDARPDWTISAGAGRWWPTWRPVSVTSAF